MSIARGSAETQQPSCFKPAQLNCLVASLVGSVAGLCSLCSAAAVAACPRPWLSLDLISHSCQLQVSRCLLTGACWLFAVSAADILSWSSQPLQLIFYGDDVTVEQFQGDCEHPGCAEGPAVFQKYFGDWRSAAFGITGAPGRAAAITPLHSAPRVSTKGLRALPLPPSALRVLLDAAGCRLL